MSEEVYALSIAGFDPTGGAGVLADIKTYESHGVMGLAVCTAITYQTATSFHGLKWCGKEEVLAQLGPLLQTYEISAVKIGVIENLDRLKEVLLILRRYKRSIRIVWDPVLRASAGFDFHEPFQKHLLDECLDLVDLLTPNLEEAEQLGEGTVEENVQAMSQRSAVLLKGGHETGAVAKDVLYQKGVVTKSYASERLYGVAKHGTGCVLSSSIAANWSKGEDLFSSCELAKHYMQHFIVSTNGPLGRHTG